VSTLFQVELIDTNGIDPDKTVYSGSETPERRKTVLRDWQHIILWAEKNGLAQ
jgi:hypothetical protein